MSPVQSQYLSSRARKSLLTRTHVLPSVPVLSVGTGSLKIKTACHKLTCDFVDPGVVPHHVHRIPFHVFQLLYLVKLGSLALKLYIDTHVTVIAQRSVCLVWHCSHGMVLPPGFLAVRAVIDRGNSPHVA